MHIIIFKRYNKCNVIVVNEAKKFVFSLKSAYVYCTINHNFPQQEKGLRPRFIKGFRLFLL